MLYAAGAIAVCVVLFFAFASAILNAPLVDDQYDPREQRLIAELRKRDAEREAA